MPTVIDTIEIPASAMHFEALVAGPKDGEAVICLHGFPQFADAWLPLFEPLVGLGYRVVAFNQRGYSNHARPSNISAYNINKILEDLFAVADSLGIKKFHVIGHDWGGIIAWHAGADLRRRVLSVTSLSTPHPTAFLKALRVNLDQKLKSSYFLLFKAPFHMAEKVLTAKNWMLFRAMYQAKVSPEQIQKNRDRMSQDQALTAGLNWYRGKWGEAGPCLAPALFIWGSKDPAFGQKAVMDTKDYTNASYRLEVLENRSHWLIDEEPKRISELVVGHLQSLPKG